MVARLGWGAVAVLSGAAAFELVLAARHSLTPGGEGYVLLAAAIAMLVAIVLVFRRVPPAALFAPLAAAFVTARFYTQDPYYGSTYRRYSDGGILPHAWIFALLGVAVAAGVATQLWRRTPPLESAIVLALLLFTALFMGVGH